jgi:hypothetical protein
MNNRSRMLAAILAVCALIALAPTAALAAPTTANLRVEGDRGQALDPGTNYATDTPELKTNAEKCEGSGRSHTLSFPSAMGIVQDAAKANGDLDPFWISDRWYDEYGSLIVCQIGASGAFDAYEAWLYKVDHRSPEVGADQYRLRGGDKVLWYFANFRTGENTGKELALAAPDQVRANEPFSVRATAYDSGAKPRAAAGVEITGGDATAVTNPGGRATVTASREGTITLRGTHRPDIPSAPVEVQVSANPEDTRSPSSPPSGGDSGSETGPRPEGGAGSGPGSGTGSRPGATRAGSSGSGSGGGSRSGDSSPDTRANPARSAAVGAARADAGGGSGGGSGAGRSNEGTGDDVDGSGTGRANEGPGGDVEGAWDGGPLGELLSASDVKAPPKPVPDPAAGRTGPGGGVWLVLLFVALGAVLLTASGGFLLRRPRIRTLLSRSLASGPFSRIASTLQSSRPSSE